MNEITRHQQSIASQLLSKDKITLLEQEDSIYTFKRIYVSAFL